MTSVNEHSLLINNNENNDNNHINQRNNKNINNRNISSININNNNSNNLNNNNNKNNNNNYNNYNNNNNNSNTGKIYLRKKKKWNFRKKILPLIVIVIITAIVVCLVVFSLPYDSSNTIYNQSPFVIKEDDNLLQLAIKSRQNLLNIHGNQTISKLDFAILLSNPIGYWQLATFNGKNNSEPQQTLFLPLLAAAVNWCMNQNNDPHCLQMAAGPMMNDMSSIHAGILMDIITNAPNQEFQTSNSTGFQSWLTKRESIESFLDSFDLLGNQTIINKFYPSNSGPTATWGEGLVQKLMGDNQMCPYDSALLMLNLVKSGILSEGQSYMTDLISRQTFSTFTSIGFGLPPGTTLHSVLGASSSTKDLNEIAHLVLPNGGEMIFSIFSNGYENFGHAPYQSSILGNFAGDLIRSLGIDIGCPNKIVMTSQDKNCTVTGAPWTLDTSIQAYNSSFLYISGGVTPTSTVTWTFTINVTGLYEVCVWFPSGDTHTSVSYKVEPGDGMIYFFPVDQVHYGARWIRLDSFFIVAGNQPIISLSNRGIDPSKTVVADSVKLTRWPSSKGIPGFSNDFVIAESPQ
ncbi:hypothetical protein ACTFIV_009545 [Dictyostelium citrinum]